jgi:AcrR family transcriptional regulator
MNEKKQLLVITALDLFYKNGINSVGINEILKASGIAKKTLYKHFESKDKLIIATLAQRHSTFIDWLQSCVEHSTTNKDFVREFFNALTLWFNNKVAVLVDFRGCYFINTAAECALQSENIFQFCQQHKENVRAMLKENMPVFDEPLLDLICMLKEGAIASAFVSRDLNAADKCIGWGLADIENRSR